jgi:RNA polymerase sigma factor (sigma-70 family)
MSGEENGARGPADPRAPVSQMSTPHDRGGVDTGSAVAPVALRPLKREGELGREELRSAEQGFRRLLIRKGFSPSFLERHSADLLAQAHLEYTRSRSRGEEIDSPVGWLIHCAWRRTQDLLRREDSAPALVPILDEAEAPPPVSLDPTPERELEEAERHRKVRAAVSELSAEERQVIALTYFEGMTIREAGRTLRWYSKKAIRRHSSGLRRLHELLGVEEADQLAIEIGAAAWALAFAARDIDPAPGFLGRLMEVAGEAILEPPRQLHELARRLTPGRSTAESLGAAGARSAEVGGGGILAAGTAGVCGAAAATCLAVGVLAHGGGNTPRESNHARRTPAAKVAVHSPSPAMIDGAEEPSALGKGASAERSRRKAQRRHAPNVKHADAIDAAREDTGEASRSSPRPVVEAEFDPMSGAGEPVQSEPAAEAAPESSRTSSEHTSSPPPAASGKQVEAEFGFR